MNRRVEPVPVMGLTSNGTAGRLPMAAAPSVRLWPGEASAELRGAGQSGSGGSPTAQSTEWGGTGRGWDGMGSPGPCAWTGRGSHVGVRGHSLVAVSLLGPQTRSACLCQGTPMLCPRLCAPLRASARRPGRAAVERASAPTHR